MDISRHEQMFNPDMYIKPVHVIGLGATGSRIAQQLFRDGLRNIYLWDDDKVEPHNIPNQAFFDRNIGIAKAESVANLFEDIDPTCDGGSYFITKQKVTGSTKLTGTVFLLVDTMAARKEIWEGGIKGNKDIDYMIETRMGADELRVYTVDPNNQAHIEAWQESLCTDEEAKESLCGSKISVGATAETVSGLAVWQFIHTVMGGKVTNEVIMNLNPVGIMTDNF